ncbi:MAG TPA: LrgB family protein [Caldilinea sp.]|nr:LrgB family protein [Caldilinea sp.]HRA65556.1 LrgB family protein [Caldilinea sp.]
MIANPSEIWVYLAASPLLHLTMTLTAYLVGDYCFRKSGQKAIFNPVLMAIVLLVVILRATNTSYETYFEGAQFVHFLLGPATVALAVPLYRQFDRVRHSAPAILVSLLAGSVTAVLSATLIAWLLGAPQDVIASIAPKSATTPIAMGVSEQIGGLPSLTAVLVILTGIVGAMAGTTILERVGVRDAGVQGFALGLTSHGIGTARALQVSEVAGAFSALAMGLNGLATSLLAPLLVHLLGLW